MDIESYNNYFRVVATQHPDILHTTAVPRFARINIEEVLSSLRSKLDLKHYCLLLESYEGFVDGPNMDQLYDNKVGAFTILKNCRVDDFNEENLICAQAEVIGKKVIARMFTDSQASHLQNVALTPIKNFDPRTVKYFKVGPIFDNAFGFRFEYDFFENNPFRFDSDEWLPATPDVLASGCCSLPPLDTKTADYVASEDDAGHLVPFDCSDGNKRYIIPNAVGQNGKKYAAVKVDASAYKLSIVSAGPATQINFNQPLECFYQGELHVVQSNNVVYLPSF